MSTRPSIALAYPRSPDAIGLLSPIAPLLSFGALFAFLICYLVFDGQPAIAWSIVTIAAPGAIAAQRFRDQGLLDPLGLFCFAFVAYNGVLLLRLATMGDPTATPYPLSFTQEAYGRAGLLNAIAAVTIFATATVASRVLPTKTHFDQVKASHPGRNSAAWFYSGLIMYVIGLAMYFLEYDQIGGYLAGIKGGRGNRFDEFHSAALSWPYLAFLIPGLAAVWYSAAHTSTKATKWIARAALVLWCGLLVPQGDRLLVLQAILATAAVSFVCRRRKLALGIRLCVLLTLAYIALAAFGYLRVAIAPWVSGEMTNADVEFFLATDPLGDHLKPERSELAGPYLSLLQVTTDSQGDILQGNSYANAIMSVLPKALYPGTKPIYLSELFAQTIHRGKGPVSGWGFNPVAEAYLNFGMIGIVFPFMLWTIAFYVLSALKVYPPVGTLIFAVLLPEAIDANRMDFRNVYCIVVYFTAGVAITFMLTKFFQPRYARHS
jgi:hypothetical protein